VIKSGVANEDLGVQDRIISATIDCIERNGVEGTTIRRIAAQAGVNSAAISYYFRGKDNLVAVALERALGNAFDWGDFEGSDSLPARERLCAILDHLLAGAVAYSGTARALFHDTIVSGRYDTPAMTRLAAFLDRLADDLASRGVSLDRASLRVALAQAAAATFVTGSVMPGLCGHLAGLDLAEPSDRRRYVESLVRGLLPEPGASSG
jgi:AcrR family transcriptional regulator